MEPDAVSELFDEWAARLARGESPDPVDYLERAGDAAPDLQRLMEAFLLVAPRPAPSAEDVELARAWLRGDSPIAELRARRGIRRDEVVDAIVGEFGLTEEQRPAVKRYYHRFEAGLLDPEGLSAPLVSLLERTLGVARAALLTWRAKRVVAAPAYRAARSVGDVSMGVPEPDDEQVGSLFLSGR